MRSPLRFLKKQIFLSVATLFLVYQVITPQIQKNSFFYLTVSFVHPASCE
jgi:hypothetical protein